ncbi:hypothetical protein X797_001263 [Metarhizium robertsii]|uniref:Uncharacterized protein n=1 Tax=Metarhizium robertsii TaxID=568076 RepID=A0A0A1V9Z3_9HYPO|nr:hypothetical protein X797_001263 [Metarhizium robertsii]
MHLTDLFIHATAALGAVADYNGKKQGAIIFGKGKPTDPYQAIHDFGYCVKLKPPIAAKVHVIGITEGVRCKLYWSERCVGESVDFGPGFSENALIKLST